MKSLRWLLLLLLVPVLQGCPVGTDYPLGAMGKEKLNKQLLGTWSTDNADAAFGMMTIAQETDKTYRITVDNLGEMYMIDPTEFIGWTTTLDGYTFMVSQPVDAEDQSYYHYGFRFTDNNQLESFEVRLLVGGMDAVTSTETFREELSGSLKMDSCISDIVVWYKE